LAPRYFSALPIQGSLVKLDGDEAHHLARVMRAKPGEAITLFDGTGVEFQATIEAVSSKQVELRIESQREVDRELPRRLTLAVALPKGDRQRYLVEKLVELGVARLVPLETRRGVAKPTESAVERLRRAVIEASKQCGRNRLMEIAEGTDWRAFAPLSAEQGQRFLAHPAAEGAPPTPLPATGDVIVAIGPEGGFDDDEVRLALEHGWLPLDLGPRILRVETAAALVAALASR